MFFVNRGTWFFTVQQYDVVVRFQIEKAFEENSQQVWSHVSGLFLDRSLVW